MKPNLGKIGSEQRIGLLIFMGVFIVSMVFAGYTHHAWEDYYITYRVSKNLATGQGPVYTIGERVQAFTSPLNTLLPAFLIIITGNTSDQLVLWLFRILCCSLLGAAAVLLFNAARKNSLTLIPVAVLIGMFAFDNKIIDFSINGQEVAFMMFFIALVLNALTTPSRWMILKLGLGWAGLMWTRPDGFIYFGAIALGFLLFNGGKPIGQSRRDLLKIFFLAGITTAVLYLPWFLWSWSYFGSPIPNTIIAKGYTAKNYTPNILSINFGQLILDFILFPVQLLLGGTSANKTFLPNNAVPFGGWHFSVMVFSTYLSYLCAIYWCFPFGNLQARAVSFAFMICHFYLTYIAAYSASWYIPNCAILAIFVFAYFLQQLLNLSSLLKIKDTLNTKRLINFVRISAVFVVSVTLLLTVCSAYQLRIQQREVEDGNRKKIGLWLREHAASLSDSVFLEPLGYIGYFSQLKMLDYPGLCAPEVIAAQKMLQSSSWAMLIRQLHPNWLVLRPEEANTIYRADPSLTQQYLQAKIFDASKRIESYHWLPGRGYLTHDQTFIVFRLKSNIADQNQPQNQK
ncbi:MAG: hypothetical protein ABSE89_05945 [Sedimentisphaerales bacterium]